MSKLNITAIIEKSSDGWYVGQLLEYPEAISQGKNVEELKKNLLDAMNMKLIMDVNREETAKKYFGRKTIRRNLTA